MFIDPHVHRLLAVERSAELRRSMAAVRGGESGLMRVVAALASRIANRRRPHRYEDRPEAAGLPR